MPKPYSVAETPAGRFPVPDHLSHRPVVQALARGELHEARTLDRVGTAGRGRAIVHAGTFVGAFLPTLSRAASRVWAFEPVAENHAYARLTVELNGLDNVELHHAALGERAGRLLMRVHRPDGEPLGGQSWVDEGAQGEEAGVEEVPVLRLDDVLPPDEDVGVIQLDVEGYEGPVLAGALRTLERCRPLVILETPPGRSDYRRTLRRFGYRKTARVDGNVVYSRERPSWRFRLRELGHLLTLTRGTAGWRLAQRWVRRLRALRRESG